MTVDKIDDLIKNLLVSISPEYNNLDFDREIQPKKKKKKFVGNSNNEGLSILDSEIAEYVDFGKIKKGRVYKRKENIEDWKSSDFVFHIKELYEDIFDDHWNFNFGGICLEVTRLHDSIVFQNGFCNSLVLRDYINFYFKLVAPEISKRKKKFYIQSLRDEMSIKRFLGKYNFKSSLNKEHEQRALDKFKNLRMFNTEEIEKSILVGEENFLIEYGFVNFINWFILVEDKDKAETIKKALLICKSFYKKKDLDDTLDAVEASSPYPKWFEFKRVDKFLEQIDKYLKVNVKFVFNYETDRKYKIMRKKHG